MYKQTSLLRIYTPLLRFAIALLVLVASMLVFVPAAHAEEDWNKFDTVAGFPMTVEIDGNIVENITRLENKKITLLGECPGGTIEERSYVKEKSAIFTITEQWTQHAGPCRFSVLDNVGNPIAEGFAEIFPDVTVSKRLELLNSEDDLEKGRQTTLRAGFFDQYGNPAATQIVLMSSDADIEPSGYGEEGYTHFSVIPVRGGNVSFTVVDTITGESKRFTFIVQDPFASTPVTEVPSTRRDSVTMLLGELIRASLLDEYTGSSGTANGNAESVYDLIDMFEVEVGDRQSTVRVNDQQDLIITALDRTGRKRITDYVSSVLIETTDINAIIPTGAVRFRATDRGQKILRLGITFQTPGEQTVTVRDETDPDGIFGTATVWVLGQSSKQEERKIAILEYPNTSDGRSVMINGAAPAYTNLHLLSITDDGEEIVLAQTSSDEVGVFSFQITLKTNMEEYTLFIQDPEGRVHESEIITIIIDSTIPVLKDIIITPEDVLPGATFSVSVTAESGEEVSVSLNGDQERLLTEGAQNSEGTSIYSGSFTAHKNPGKVSVRVTVRDRAGNEATEMRELVIGVPVTHAPFVTGLQATVQNQDVILSWNAAEDIQYYRIYFGPDSINLEQMIETQGVVTNVRLTGLHGGWTYAFAITAIDENGVESMKKSEIVTATPRGSLFELKTSGRINGANLSWVTPAGVDVSRYVIRYGVQPGLYIEERATTQTQIDLPDLINGITYYFSIAALRENGTIFNDTVEATVTPGQNGIPGVHLSIDDPLPEFVGDVHGIAPTPNMQNLPIPPRMPRSGFSTFVWIMVLLAMCGAGVFFRRMRLAVREEKQLLALIDQAYR